MILSSLKTYALAALGLLSAVFSALFYREKAKRLEAERDAQEERRETETDANNAYHQGLKEKEKIIRDDSDPDINHFR